MIQRLSVERFQPLFQRGLLKNLPTVSVHYLAISQHLIKVHEALRI